ncbi:MAG: DoxX family protein [Myxococcaceae bacterium]|nr:DoxX family protein [Myxococcaceae bacterium]
MTTQTQTLTPRFAVPSFSTVARHGARVLLGAIMAFASISYFFNLVPAPTEPMAPAVEAFTGGLMAAGYMFPLIKGTELVAALLLLANRFVALALVLLAPVVVNIVAFHAVHAREGLAMSLVVAALNMGLAIAHRAAYRSMLEVRS